MWQSWGRCNLITMEQLLFHGWYFLFTMEGMGLSKQSTKLRTLAHVNLYTVYFIQCAKYVFKHGVTCSQ